MAKALQYTEEQLSLTVQRPSSRVLPSIPKGQSYGLCLGFRPKRSTCLEVVEIKNGAVSDYNKAADPDLQLQVGDFIQAVNEVTGSAKTMQAELVSSPSAKLTVLRV